MKGVSQFRGTILIVKGIGVHEFISGAVVLATAVSVVERVTGCGSFIVSESSVSTEAGLGAGTGFGVSISELVVVCKVATVADSNCDIVEWVVKVEGSNVGSDGTDINKDTFF